MSLIKVSDYIAKRLKEHGVKHFFMVSGGGAMFLNDSLGQEIPYTACHNEQACAFSAEGYARVNQKLAVVNVTTGPGGLNCLNGLFGQWTDSVPVLYISGQVKRQTMLDSCELRPRQLGDQEVDIISCVKTLTKYSVCVKNPKEIKFHLDKAIHESTTGRFGPTWLDIPIDIQSALVEEKELIEFIPEEIKKDNFPELNMVIEKLKKAKRPLIIAGHGIRLANMQQEFHQLIKKLNIPFVSTFNGFDISEDSNDFYIGRIGTIGQRAGNFALQNADLILCFGTRNNIRQISYNWNSFGKNAYKIIIDIDKAELEKPLIKPDLAIQADIKEILPELIKIAEHSSNIEWHNYCKTIKSKYSFKNHPEHIQGEHEINPYYFVEKLTSKLNNKDILVSANATPSICIFQVGHLNGQRIIMNSGDASMGFGLPASIGAVYSSKKEQRVVCIEGDGSIMMNLQELQTIKHYNLPIKLFIINNSGYSSIRQSQKNFFDGRMTGSGKESGVSVPDFVEVAKAFGLNSCRIDNPENMEEKIEWILNTSGAIICEVVVEKEYSFAPKLSSKKLDDGTIVSPSLEDMYPFLERSEFEENMI